MYLRFISRSFVLGATRWLNVDYGIFQAAFRCREDDLLPDYLLSDLMDEVVWFQRYLPSPDERHFSYRGGANTGICWFKDDAQAMIRRARRMVNIMRAGDVWITESRTGDPGHILYRDDYQIIARPNRATPTRWG